MGGLAQGWMSKDCPVYSARPCVPLVRLLLYHSVPLDLPCDGELTHVMSSLGSALPCWPLSSVPL